MVFFRMLLLLSSFTVGFAYQSRGDHGPYPESPPEYEEPDFPIHPVDEVVGVKGPDAALPYCDEVEADKPKPHINPPELIEDVVGVKVEPNKKWGGYHRRRKWHVNKEFTKMGKQWRKKNFGMKMWGIGRALVDSVNIPCLRREIEVAGVCILPARRLGNDTRNSRKAPNHKHNRAALLKEWVPGLHKEAKKVRMMEIMNALSRQSKLASEGCEKKEKLK